MFPYIPGGDMDLLIEEMGSRESVGKVEVHEYLNILGLPFDNHPLTNVDIWIVYAVNRIWNNDLAPRGFSAMMIDMHEWRVIEHIYNQIVDFLETNGGTWMRIFGKHVDTLKAKTGQFSGSQVYEFYSQYEDSRQEIFANIIRTIEPFIQQYKYMRNSRMTDLRQIYDEWFLVNFDPSHEQMGHSEIHNIRVRKMKFQRENPSIKPLAKMFESIVMDYDDWQNIVELGALWYTMPDKLITIAPAPVGLFERHIANNKSINSSDECPNGHTYEFIGDVMQCVECPATFEMTDDGLIDITKNKDDDDFYGEDISFSMGDF